MLNGRALPIFRKAAGKYLELKQLKCNSLLLAHFPLGYCEQEHDFQIWCQLAPKLQL